MCNTSQPTETSYKWLDEYISEYPFSYIFIETLFYDIPDCFRNYVIQWQITEKELEKFYKGTEEGTFPSTFEELKHKSTIEAIQKFSALFQDRLKYHQKDTDEYTLSLKETIEWLDKGVLLSDPQSIYERAFYLDDTQSHIINKSIQNNLLRRAVQMGYEPAIKSFIGEKSVWNDAVYALDIAPRYSHLIFETVSQRYKSLFNISKTFDPSCIEIHLALMEAGVSGSNTQEAKILLMEDLMRIIFFVNEDFYRKYALSQTQHREYPSDRKSVYTLLGMAYYSKYGASTEDHAAAEDYVRKAKTAGTDFTRTFQDNGLPPEKLLEVKKRLDESGLF